MLFRWSNRSFHKASTGLRRVGYCESASGLESTSYTFFRTGKLSQRTGAESAPSVSKSANVPQNAGINSAPAHDHIFRHFISSLNPDDPSVTWINAGALDFLSRLERDGRLFELRAFTSTTATDLNDIQRSLFKDCVKKTLTMAGRFEHEK